MVPRHANHNIASLHRLASDPNEKDSRRNGAMNLTISQVVLDIQGFLGRSVGLPNAMIAPFLIYLSSLFICASIFQLVWRTKLPHHVTETLLTPRNAQVACVQFERVAFSIRALLFRKA